MGGAETEFLCEEGKEHVYTQKKTLFNVLVILVCITAAYSLMTPPIRLR